MALPAGADPLETKLLLALFGVVAGWLLKTAWEEVTLRLRWRRLAPLVMRQLAGAGEACARSVDTTLLPLILARLGSAQASATDLVAAGVHPAQWTQGLELIMDCLDGARAVEAAPQAIKAQSLEALRAQGQRLAEWARKARS